MDDDSADSKLLKLAPPELEELKLLPELEWYQPGSGGTWPVAAWYFAAHRAAAPPATANGTYAA
jgi:hypothetical protein